MKRRQERDGEKLGKCVFGCCVPSVSHIRSLVLRLCSVRADSALQIIKCVNLLNIFLLLRCVLFYFIAFFPLKTYKNVLFWYIFLDSSDLLLDRYDLMRLFWPFVVIVLYFHPLMCESSFFFACFSLLSINFFLLSSKEALVLVSACQICLMSSLVLSFFAKSLYLSHTSLCSLSSQEMHFQPNEFWHKAHYQKTSRHQNLMEEWAE